MNQQEDEYEKTGIKVIDNRFYVASKIAEVTAMEEDAIQAIVEQCFAWASELTDSEFREIEDHNCLADIENIIELINYYSAKELIAIGLSFEEKRCVRERITSIAMEKNISPGKLGQALIKKGIYYLDLKQYFNRIQIVLTANESRLLDSGKFSRSDLEKWLYYVYLGSLFITEL